VIEDIYIGVDGGGTKCKARIEDEAGNLLGQAVGGPANIRLSVDMAWQSIYQTVEEILNLQNISLHDNNYRFHAGFGLAGCEVKEACEAFVSTPNPFSTVHLTSDAHAACVGAHAGKDGAIIIVGTGVVGYQTNAGNTHKVSGWGFPHDDEGGGAWLGLQAVRRTFKWFDGRAEKSPLLDEVFAYFDSDINYFTAWANRATSNEFARLAPLVINHCQQGDIVAEKILKKAAHAISEVGKALIKSQPKNESPLPCCLFGGIAPFIELWLTEDLRSRIVPRQGDANTGAILIVRELERQKQFS
jgi:glucosamine kinase